MKTKKTLLDAFKPELNLINFFWCFLVFLPILLKETYFRKIIEWFPFDIFNPNALIIMIIIFVLGSVIISNDQLQQILLKWIFPILIWLGCYFHDISNHNVYLIFLSLFYLIIILFSVTKQIVKNCEVEYINQGLISDDPIEPDEEKDSFGRRNYAKSIVSEIRKTVNKRAFNIAVTGAWGSGKTSFLNLIKGEMDREVDDKKVKFITVNYNPWDFKEDKIIGLDLLKTISHELANEKELQEKFKSLMVSLQGVDESPWYKVIPNLLIGFSTEKSINDYREEIGKALQDQDKKLVIFLDDLDRLDGDEILEVFKTIRNSFNIANTFFILGFDTDYVVDQIEGKVKGNVAKDRAVEYLDKIFQMQLFMPSNSDYPWFKEFKTLVKDHFGIDVSLHSNFPIYDKRKLFQFVNSLKVFYSENKIDDYNFKALVNIEFIKIKYPKFYSYVSANLYFVLDKYNSVNSTTIFVNGGSHNNTWETVKDEFYKMIESIECIRFFEDFFKELDENQEYKVKSEDFVKYFKYALQNKEFSSSLLRKIIKEQDNDLLNDSLTENNKESLFGKIDVILEKDPDNSWLVSVYINLIYKDKKYLWLYSKKNFLNKFSAYSSYDDLKTKIESLETKDKIIFLTELDVKNDAVNEYLISLFTEYFKGNIDDLFWLVYHSLKENDLNILEKFKQEFILITRETISKNYLEIFKSAVSIIPEGKKGGSRVNHTDPSYYYLVGLFSSQDWLSLIPEDKNDEFPYSDIKNWLNNLDSDHCGELNYTHVFGRDYFDRFSTLVESKLEEE